MGDCYGMAATGKTTESVAGTDWSRQHCRGRARLTVSQECRARPQPDRVQETDTDRDFAPQFQVVFQEFPTASRSYLNNLIFKNLTNSYTCQCIPSEYKLLNDLPGCVTRFNPFTAMMSLENDH